MKRRDFNRLAAGLTANVALGSWLQGCATSTAVVPTPPLNLGDYKSAKGRIVATATKKPGESFIRVMDWDDYQFTDYEVPLDLVHSVVRDKADHDILYVFEVFGSAARINLRTGSVVKVDHRDGREMFNGHGALSSDGSLIACTEVDPKGNSGPIRLRSTKDLSIVGELPGHLGCHQIIAMSGSTVFAAGTTVKGLGNGISFYDYAKKKVVGLVKTPGSVVHVAQISPTEVVGACRDSRWDDKMMGAKFNDSATAIENVKSFQVGIKYGAVPLAIAAMDGGLRTLEDQARHKDFISNFGVAPCPEGRLVSTHTWADKVFVWKDSKIQHSIDAKQPLNVTISADAKEFMVLVDGKVKIYSLATAKLVKEFDGWPVIRAISGYA